MIPFAVILFLQHPSAQNWLAKQALSIVDEHINGEIHIDRVMVVFFNKVVVRDGWIVGNQNDTLVSFKELSISISSKNLLRGKLKANRILISDGVFNYYVEGENKESNISRIFGSSDTESKGINLPPAYITELRLRDFRFNYIDPYQEKIHNDKECIDFSDLSISNIDIKLNSISYENGVLRSHLENIACIDKSGWGVNTLRGDFSLDAKETRIENLFLKDQYSTIRANYLSFKYNSGKDINTFTDSIRMGADFKNAFLDFRTLGKITPALKKNTLAIYISGEVNGPVRELNTKYLKVKSLSNETKLEVATTIKGLPDIDNTIFDIDIKSLETFSPDIARLIASFSGTEPLKAIYSISPYTKINYSCLANGTIDSLSLNGELTSDVGGIKHDVQLINKGKKGGISLLGDIMTTDLNLGRILNNKLLGHVSLETNINSTFIGEEYDKIEFKIDHLKIGRLGLNGYDYSNLIAVGEYSGEKFDGKVISHDPNLHFIFQGIFSLSRSRANQIYNFYLDIPFADLEALNIDKRGGKSQLSLRTVANISNALKGKDLFGMIDMKNFSYTNNNGIYEIGNISLHSSYYEDLFKMNLNSPFMTADYESYHSPILFLSKLKDILLYEQFGDVFHKEGAITDTLGNGNYKLNLETFNTRGICEVFVPGLFIADSTRLDLNISENNDLKFNLSSDKIAMDNFSLKDIHLDLSNPDSLLICNINSSQITAGGGISTDNNDINIISEKGKIHLKFLFVNEGDIKNDLSFSSDIFFDRDHNNNLLTNININESNLYLKGYEWVFSPSSLIIGQKDYDLRNFKMYNEDQEITANGRISSNPRDRLSLNLNNFDLSIINSFLNNDLEIEGYFTGEASILDMYGSPRIVMDLEGTNVSVFENQVGILKIQSKWDQINKRINLLLVNTYLDKDPINISGYYQPNSRFLNIDLALQDFSLTYLGPFLEGILMDISGTLSGDMVLFGRLDMLNITTSNSRFEDFKFTPVFTKVPYTLNGPIEMSASEVSLVNMNLTDKYNSVATINGSISHRFFKDLFLDAKLDFKNLECLNTNLKDNKQFYGTAFATGNINITGAIDDILLDVDVSTNEKTAIHVPLSSSASATTNDLLSFVKEDTSTNIDSTQASILSIEDNNIRESKLEIRGKATVTPETEVFIEIDKELGNILRCKGSGTIDFNINPTKDIMDIRGDYTVQEGDYNFVLLSGLTSKNFLLQEGGNISFNGDIMKTSMNIGATYRTKASVSTLIADTTVNRRTVDCGIKLFGTLNNPLVEFSIDIPDLAPITKGKVESALSTADKIQKQFMALILSGSFIPDEQSGIVNNTLLFSNASEIVSNQFNNIFRQLGIPLDLGLNYQPGEEGRDDIFDVAVSLQVLNNRLVINGNVGTGQNSTRGDMMANVEAEYKIDKQGKMRLMGFSKSADSYTNYLDYSQRSGLGFTYQDEFDNFKEFWQSIFYSRKRKEEIETKKLLDAEAALKKEAEHFEAIKQKVNKAKESPYMRHY